MNCPFCHAPQSRLEEHGTTMVRCLDCQEVCPRAHALQHASRIQAGLTPAPRPWEYVLDADALCYPSVLGIQLLDLHLPDPIAAVEVLADYERSRSSRRYDCGECQDWTPALGLAGRPGHVVEAEEGVSETYVVARVTTLDTRLDTTTVDFPTDRQVRRRCGQTNQRWVPPSWKPDPGPEGSCTGCVLSYLDKVDHFGRVVHEESDGYRPQHRGSYRSLRDLPSERTRARFWQHLRRMPRVHVDYLGPVVDVSQLTDEDRALRQGSPDIEHTGRDAHLRRLSPNGVVTAVFSSARADWLEEGNWRPQARLGRDTGWSASRWVGRAPYRITGSPA